MLDLFFEMKPTGRYIQEIAVFTVGILIVSIAAILVSPNGTISFTILTIPPFFFVVIVASRVVILWSKQRFSVEYTMALLMVSGFRFILYLLVVLIFSIIFPEKAVGFVIAFFIFYLIYSVFEVLGLLKEFKSK